MRNLLLDEAPLVLLPSSAGAVGLNEAIILQQIHYWLKITQADPDKYKDGFREDQWWVYNSVEEWRKQFLFWSKRHHPTRPDLAKEARGRHRQDARARPRRPHELVYD